MSVECFSGAIKMNIEMRLASLSIELLLPEGK